ncbi:9054_t:CDS:2, partial [Acaulospora colombiana]
MSGKETAAIQVIKDEPKSDVILDVPQSHVRHGGKKINSIVVSPNNKYVATWSEADNSIAGWLSIKGQMELQFDAAISLRDDFNDEFKLEELVAVSDTKHVAIRKNGNFVLILREPKYRAYVFAPIPSKGPFALEKYKLKNMIELTSFVDCIITLDGKLLIINKRVIHTINQWDLESLSFEQEYILDCSLRTDTVSARFNENKTLLVVFGRSPKDFSTNTFDDKIYVYSVERGIKVNMYTYKNNAIIDQAHFIASDIAERLLVIFRNKDDDEQNNYEIMDPWTLKDPADARILFQLEHEGNVYFNPCIVKDSIIYGVHDRQPRAQNLIKHDWINYLREALHDYNEINAPPSGMILEKMIRDAAGIYSYKLTVDDSEWVARTPIGKDSYRGHLYKWDVDCGSDKVIIGVSKFNVTTEIWTPIGKPRNILPESHIERESRLDFVVQCQLLYNDDLAIITPMGIFIWTVTSKGIRLFYFWGDTEAEYEKTHVGVANILYKIQSLKLTFTGQTLPSPDFDHILLYYEKFSVGRDKDRSEPFRELLDDYIHTHELLAFHGEYLLKRMIFHHKDNWIESMCEECSQKYAEDPMQLGFLSIVIASFPSLCQRHPSFVTKFMATFALQLPHTEKSEIINNLSTASHLQHYGKENHLYVASYATRTYNNIKNASERFSKRHPYFHTFFTFLFVPMWPVLIYQFYERYYNPDLYFQPTIKLMIPLPKYSTYPKNTRGIWDFFFPMKNSFVNPVTSNEVYHWWNGEALLNHKWNTFGKYYYYTIWFVYTLFLLSFAIVATIPEDQINWSVASGLLVTTILLGCLHLLVEIRQFTITPKGYVTNLWNAFVIAFAHSLHLLLRPEEPISLEIANFNDDPNNPWNLVSTMNSISSGAVSDDPVLISKPSLNTNLFVGWDTSLLAVYYMLNGDTSSVSSW